MDPARQLSGIDTPRNLSTPPPYTPNPHIRSPPVRKSPPPQLNFRSPSPLPGSVDPGGSDGDSRGHSLYYPRTSHKVPRLQAPQDGGKGGRGNFRIWSHWNAEVHHADLGRGVGDMRRPSLFQPSWEGQGAHRGPAWNPDHAPSRIRGNNGGGGMSWRPEVELGGPRVSQSLLNHNPRLELQRVPAPP